MPVRGSTEWQHAQVYRKIVNLDHEGTQKIHCATLDCEREAYQQFVVVQHEHLRAVHFDGRWRRGSDLCSAIDAGLIEGIHRRWAFCSERHLQLFRYGMGPQSVAMAASNGGHAYGSLPTGYQGSML